MEYNEEINDHMGITPRAIKQIFSYIKEVKCFSLLNYLFSYLKIIFDEDQIIQNLIIELRKNSISNKSFFHASLHGANN